MRLDRAFSERGVTMRGPAAASPTSTRHASRANIQNDIETAPQRHSWSACYSVKDWVKLSGIDEVPSQKPSGLR